MTSVSDVAFFHLMYIFIENKRLLLFDTQNLFSVFNCYFVREAERLKTKLKWNIKTQSSLDIYFI